MKNHDIVEKNIGLMIVLVVVAISFGGLVEIVPQFFIKDNKVPIAGLKPLGAIELEGRDIYIREGCHVCHTQMVRPLRAEVERYGHYSMAQEHVYEHPFLWGSKRTGPDLARVGGRYSDEWHRAHLYDPRNVVPESIMPSYPWLFDNVITGEHTAAKMRAMRVVGVPYTDEDIANASKPFIGGRVTEIDALVAYLQQLGTLVQQKR
ncbi:cytochrome-c oxidase, cbb3-type subunit II [uncultured Microbulbifer sp.]|uniref:cytochrome-c oxidase, cbb3-type subunit II n=1 Tax=uncultured Microbulbifer sp. TaxID=348147 RepID=UPI00261FF551|nr:cytochrome-c oxidase, cbb3-type subunit II [uncultured Microbulbifer sp.]